MDNITIYEFLQEKSTVPMGPDSYSDSGELTNSFRAKSNNEANEAVIKQIIERTITEIKNSKVTSIGDNAFYRCSLLTNVDFPEATGIGTNSFNTCSSLTNVVFPKVTSIGSNAFYYCLSLTNVDFPKVTRIRDYAFFHCSSLETLILRKNEVATLDPNAFASTKIASGAGYIYVPDDLVDSYKAAENWSTYAAQIKGLSELPDNS